VANRAIPRLTGNESLARYGEISSSAAWVSVAIGISALLAIAVVAVIDSRLAACEIQVAPSWSPRQEGVYVGPDGEVYRARQNDAGMMVVERKNADGSWSFAPASAIQGLERAADSPS